MRSLITSSSCCDASCFDNSLDVSCEDAMEEVEFLQLNSGHSIWELESANSIQATEPSRKCCNIGSTNTRKGINAPTGVQHQHMECTPAKGCNRNIGE